MSYPSRRPQRMPEQWKSMSVAFGGGLAEDYDPLAVDPGRMANCLNWEAVYGVQGYRTIKGYERLDGRGTAVVSDYQELRYRSGLNAGTGTDLSPFVGGSTTITNQSVSATGAVVSDTRSSGSWLNGDAAGTLVLTNVTGTWLDNDAIHVGGSPKAVADGSIRQMFDGDGRASNATYAVLNFDAGIATISAGDTVTNQYSASGYVVSVDVESGSFTGGDAAGVIVITSIQGSWDDNEQIQVGGVQKATANGASFLGTRGNDDLHQERLTAARNALRALIQKPTGAGPILGGCVFNDRIYVVRNNTENTSATLWRATTAGWTSIKTGMEANGDYKFWQASFTGDPDDLALYFVNGKGRLRKMTRLEVVTKADPIYGTEAVSTTANNITTGAKTWTLTTTTRSYQVGDEAIGYDATDASKWVSGPIAGYNSGTNQLSINVTATSGSGSVSNWEFGLLDYSDKPFDLLDHKDHMFLLYPRGQLQTSNLGDPMVYTTTAAAFGMGAEITGAVSLRGENLAIFLTERIKVLSGSSQTDWQLASHANNMGAVLGTVQDLAGNAIFLDERGLTTLQASQNYGNFEPAIMSRNIKATLDAYRGNIVGSRMVKSANQYRLYFDDGTHIRGTILTGNPVLTDKDMAFTVCKYDHNPTCFFSGQVEGVERMFFGTEDGYLMEEDSGTSFDGAEISYAFRLPYNFAKSPGVTKRWHKLMFQMRSADPINLNVRLLFSMDDSAYRFDGNTLSTNGTGGYFDAADFDTVRFDLPSIGMVGLAIRGVGNSLAQLIFFSSDFVQPVTLHSQIVNYSVLGIER